MPLRRLPNTELLQASLDLISFFGYQRLQKCGGVVGVADLLESYFRSKKSLRCGRTRNAPELLDAARRRELDVVLVWRLDRWDRSLVDLVVTLKELAGLSIGFVSLTEALDLTTTAGRAMAGLLSVFAKFEHDILRERIRAGMAEARLNGKHLGRPVTVGKPIPMTQPWTSSALLPLPRGIGTLSSYSTRVC